MRRILTILLENQPGALSRVAGLFSARGYNIESLSVAPTHDPTLSQMTIVTKGDSLTVEQITKQLNKLIETFKVSDITDSPHLERELLMIKVRAEGDKREEMKRLTEIFRGVIINVSPQTYVIQVTGDQGKLDAFLSAVGDGNIIEIARSGTCGMSRA